MIQTVIFDMDGVIVDTEPVHKFAYYQHFNELGIHVTEEMYTSFTGNSTRNIFQKLKAQFDLTQDVEDLILRKRHLFNEAFDVKPDLYLVDGVFELIQDLYANEMQLILASSASCLYTVSPSLSCNARFTLNTSILFLKESMFFSMSRVIIL